MAATLATVTAPAADLAIGDRYVRPGYGAPEGDVTVEIIGPREEIPADREFFGRAGMFRFLAKRHDTGATGYVSFGPGAMVEKVTSR